MHSLYHEFESDLKFRGLSEGTVVRYSLCLRHFMRFADAPVDKIGHYQVRNYLKYLLYHEKMGPANYKMHLAAVKFLFNATLERPSVVANLPWPKVPRTLPDILSGQEVEALLAAAESKKHHAIFATLYSAGLRISEACSLTVNDIDSSRMVIHVRDGKGKKDRFTILSKRLLEVLRDYWRRERPVLPYLFPGDIPGRPITQEAIRQGLRPAAKAAGLRKRVTPHTLRHTFACHLLASGVSLPVIQQLLGHASIRTTMLYLQVSFEQIRGTVSPLDLLGTPNGQQLG